MNIKYLICIIVFFTANVSYANNFRDTNNQLLFTCTEDTNSGLRYINGQWNPVSFPNTGPYYIYKTPRGLLVASDANGQFKSTHQVQTGNDKWLHFEGLGMQNFHVQIENLKYTYVNARGYVTSENDVTPFISVGYCKKEKP